MSDLHAPLLRWYDDHARELPWRGEHASAWSVMVSEFMLQQTPVARVVPVHEQWLERWPTPAALAAEPAGEAVRMWGRLGYPRRALRLHAAATAIVERHGGEVPADHDDLRALPGVGDYTAAAVAVFAYGARHAVLDTNVRRVLARLVDGVELPPQSVTRAERERATALLPADDADAATWSIAVMELGALVCTASTPRCGAVPGRRAVPLGGRRLPGVRRTTAARPGLGRHRPPVPRPADGRGPRGRRPGRRGPADPAWDEADQRTGAWPASSRTVCWSGTATRTRCPDPRHIPVVTPPAGRRSDPRCRPGPR